MMAKEKARSELAERVVWLLTLRHRQLMTEGLSAYNTVGWAAHTDQRSAEESALGECLEHEYKDLLLTGLRQGPLDTSFIFTARDVPPEGYALRDSTQHIGRMRRCARSAVSVQPWSILLVYLVGLVDVFGYDTGGVIISAGHGQDFGTATAAASFELFLQARALHRRQRRGLPPRPEDLSAPVAREVATQYADVSLRRVAEQLLRRPESADREIPVGFLTDVEPYDRIRLTELQPDWLRTLGREVYFVGRQGGKDAAFLRTLVDR
jgi:hypothetical protein